MATHTIFQAAPAHRPLPSAGAFGPGLFVFEEANDE